jgi:hypothetical protein
MACSQVRSSSSVTPSVGRVLPLRWPGASLSEYDAVDNSVVGVGLLSSRPNERLACELLMRSEQMVHIHKQQIAADNSFIGRPIRRPRFVSR